MEVWFKKWGNSIGLCILYFLVISWGFDELMVVDLVEMEQGLMICKWFFFGLLEVFLIFIFVDFIYFGDVFDFVESEVIGQEWL